MKCFLMCRVWRRPLGWGGDALVNPSSTKSISDARKRALFVSRKEMGCARSRPAAVVLPPSEANLNAILPQAEPKRHSDSTGRPPEASTKTSKSRKRSKEIQVQAQAGHHWAEGGEAGRERRIAEKAWQETIEEEECEPCERGAMLSPQKKKSFDFKSYILR